MEQQFFDYQGLNDHPASAKLICGWQILTHSILEVYRKCGIGKEGRVTIGGKAEVKLKVK